MKKLALTGMELAILQGIIIRQDAGANIKTFRSIMRIEKELGLFGKSIDLGLDKQVELEDADFEFVYSEWRAANSNTSLRRVVPGLPPYEYMTSFITLDNKLEEAKNA